MTCICGNNLTICGNTAKLLKKRPKSFDKEYKCLINYPFKWRTKLGKVKCTCKICEEHFQPYYGFTWFHNGNCAIMKHLKKYPQMKNLITRDIRVIAFSD